MAKRDYNVSERFTEVARRARELNTAPKKKIEDPSENKSPRAFNLPNQAELDYASRPGKLAPGRDKNLSVETASPEVRKRLAESLRKKR